MAYKNRTKRASAVKTTYINAKSVAAPVRTEIGSEHRDMSRQEERFTVQESEELIAYLDSKGYQKSQTVRWLTPLQSQGLQVFHYTETVDTKQIRTTATPSVKSKIDKVLRGYQRPLDKKKCDAIEEYLLQRKAAKQNPAITVMLVAYNKETKREEVLDAQHNRIAYLAANLPILAYFIEVENTDEANLIFYTINLTHTVLSNRDQVQGSIGECAVYAREAGNEHGCITADQVMSLLKGETGIATKPLSMNDMSEQLLRMSEACLEGITGDLWFEPQTKTRPAQRNSNGYITDDSLSSLWSGKNNIEVIGQIARMNLNDVDYMRNAIVLMSTTPLWNETKRGSLRELASVTTASGRRKLREFYLKEVLPPRPELEKPKKPLRKQLKKKR